MGELSEIPPVPPPAQFETAGGGCCNTSDISDPALRLHQNVWVKTACQTLPNTKLRSQRGAQ
jgi:hypothetical protein